MSASGTLRLDATEGPVELRIVDGGVACDGEAITVAFAARPVDEDAWPPIYDDRARPSSRRGQCVLKHRPIGELWIPS